MGCPPRIRWIVRGDVDGFFGLALDNLVSNLADVSRFIAFARQFVGK